MPEPGQAAPLFTLRNGEGNTVSLADLRGRPVVLFFYPKDLTSGCTQEACDFRDRYAAFAEAGAVVYGISPDSEKSHQKFTAKHELPFPLLSDPGSVVCELYGVWKQKSMYGRTYMGVERTTFLIDAEGTVAQVWGKVKIPGHAGAVLAAVQGG